MVLASLKVEYQHKIVIVLDEAAMTLVPPQAKILLQLRTFTFIIEEVARFD